MAANRDLSDVILRGAALVDEVELLVFRCRTEPDPGGDLARSCGRVMSRYCDLRQRLSEMPRSALAAQVERLLHYELRIVEQASLLAFRPRDRRWGDLATAFGDGVGAPADELRRLAAELA